jgi:hypothetical protein
MSRSNLRFAIVVLTLITAIIHLVIGLRLQGVPFILNGLGFFALLIGFIRTPPILEGREDLITYVYIGYTAITILAWVVLNGDFSDLVGVGTKLVEILLILALGLHQFGIKGDG